MATALAPPSLRFLTHPVTRWYVPGLSVSMGILLIASLADSAEMASVLLLPLMLLVAAMFFTSSYFTFKDSFVNDPILA